MPLPPLPDTPCVRCALDYTGGGSSRYGSRFFLSYTGDAPSGANCTALATAIATAWSANLASLIAVDTQLVEVDVLDIASRSGFSGQWTGSEAGTQAGADAVPANCANNVEFNIARRYRGGKPRMYLPPPSGDKLASQFAWLGAFVTDTNAGMLAFFTALLGLTEGTTVIANHVSLSFYQGFKDPDIIPGIREKSIEDYRDPTATHDNILGYSAKSVIGSQRRRLRSTTY